MKYSNPTILSNSSKSIYTSKLKPNQDCSLEELNYEDFKKID